MRWLVDVTALGKSDKESLSVDADSWQKALQAARSQRGDTAPMSGFSIELLEDGCRAVDPVSKLRYEVRRADGGARSQPPRAGSMPPSTGSKRPSAPVPSAAPVPFIVAPSAAPPAPAPAAHAPAASAPPPASPTAHSSPPAHAPPPPPVHASAPPIQAVPVHMVVPMAPIHIGPPPSAPVPSAPVTDPMLAPPVAPPSHPGGDVAATVPAQIIFKREQEPTESMPLTYREYVYLVPPGTSETSAETLLVTQLELVRAALARHAAGKLVNLAAFDVHYQGKPAVPPLVTLAWKDWRDAPVLSFPRRRGTAPPPSFVPAPPRSAAPPPPPAPAPVHASAPAPAHVHAPPSVVIAQTPPPPPPAPAHVQPAVVIPIVEASAQIAVPSVAARFPEPAPVAAAPAGPPRARVRGEDLIADLFEAMHDLHFVRDAIEGAEFCLALAMEKVPSQAGIVHVYDIDKREFLVTSTRGPGTSKLLLRRHQESDPLLHAAMIKRRALVMADASTSEAATVPRYLEIGGARSLVIAPVMQSGRFLGAIEILNPLDGQPFTDAEGNALTYIAEQFAEFLSSHGIVTDVAAISSRQMPGA